MVRTHTLLTQGLFFKVSQIAMFIWQDLVLVLNFDYCNLGYLQSFFFICLIFGTGITIFVQPLCSSINDLICKKSLKNFQYLTIPVNFERFFSVFRKVQKFRNTPPFSIVCLTFMLTSSAKSPAYLLPLLTQGS